MEVIFLSYSKLIKTNYFNFLDTDSLTLATTKTGKMSETDRLSQMSAIFLPIVKKDLIEEFKNEWSRWLCLANTVEEEKRPGTLKVEFLTTNGQMISLAPKSYRAHCMTADISKIGKKGVPLWFDLKLKDYYDCLYNNEAEKSVAQVCSLRLDKEKKMSRTSLRKVGLTAIHVKRAVLDDRISTEPLKENGFYI